MTRIQIKGEQPFQVNANSFAVSPSVEGYTLNFSANGKDYTAYSEATPAAENLIVASVPTGCYFKLMGNASEVEITY